jgi:hypothetical protein
MERYTDEKQYLVDLVTDRLARLLGPFSPKFSA